MKGAGAEETGPVGAGSVGGGGGGSGRGSGDGGGAGGGGAGGVSGGGTPLGTGRDWAELLRVSALFTVPGDALAGAAATGLNPNRRTLLAIAASLSLYEAGMALNDWADREEDAVERPHRPLPSGRIAPPVALGAAAALTVGGLALAAAAGRPALTVASALAATVWAYDLGLKHTPAGPAAMAAARSLDVLLGAAATSSVSSAGAGAAATERSAGARSVSAGAGSAGAPSAGLRGPGPALRAAVPTALVLGAHTLAVTAVSRREAQGGSTLTPLAALAATAALTRLLASGGGANGGLATAGTGTSADAGTSQLPADRGGTATRGLPGFTPGELSGGRPVGQTVSQTMGQMAGPTVAHTVGRAWRAGGVTGAAPGLGWPGAALGWSGTASGRSSGSAWRAGTRGAVQAALAVTYAATAARPLFHAALNPSPQLTQRAVGGGIRAMIPLQAALSARTGALGPALLTAALAPVARRFGRKVSVT